MCKNGKCICMIFSCFMMFLICSFCINFSLEETETESMIFQTEDKSERKELENESERGNCYYHVADDAEEIEGNRVSQSLTEQVGYLEDQEIELWNRESNLENRYYHSADGKEWEEEKVHSYSLTEQVAYLIDQDIDGMEDGE